MSEGAVREGVVGDSNPDAVIATQIGTFAHRLDEIATEMGKAKDEDTARFQALQQEQKDIAGTLTQLKSKYDADLQESQVAEAVKAAAEWRTMAANLRAPSKSGTIGTMPGVAPSLGGYESGAFLQAVHAARGRDAERQAQGKAELVALSGLAKAGGDGKAFGYSDAWGEAVVWGKSTLGTTDATGGWIIPNAVVDEFITPAAYDNIYRELCTVVSGVTSAAVDIPFRSGIRNRAIIIAAGQTKTNLDLAYGGYTATMYTLAQIYDIGNQFLRTSRGAAEQDVMQELAAGFAAGEAFYVREGTGSSQPFGYTSALTNGPAAFRSTFTPSATTLAGSIAAAIATAGGALAGRGVGGAGGRDLAAVLAATSYWTMLAQGTDTAGFFFAPAVGPTGIRPGTLVSPFGVPVYPDGQADGEGTAAVIDNLVVGAWKKFKLYFGDSYRVDSSDEAGTRWDTNLTGFRGEEEMAFDARPAVYAGHFQMITDILP